MSDKQQFLDNLLKAAKKITHSDRSLAVDTDYKVVITLDIDDDILQSDKFMDFALQCLQEAVDSEDIVITNNVITNPEDAPTTNTNFANLRLVMTLPVAGYGAIYLDRHIRNGVVAKEMIERLMRLITYLIEEQKYESEDAEIIELYHALQ